MSNNREKDRDISILDYFNVLQQEYLYFELKVKIYPSSKDKEYFKKIMDFKKDKVIDIAEKNLLSTIFDSDENMEEHRAIFFNEFGNPNRLGKRDWYFYYKLGSDFSYDRKGVKLKRYNLTERSATIEIGKGETKQVSIDEISRIL